jgi:hypothetical protein
LELAKYHTHRISNLTLEEKIMWLTDVFSAFMSFSVFVQVLNINQKILAY